VERSAGWRRTIDSSPFHPPESNNGRIIYLDIRHELAQINPC